MLGLAVGLGLAVAALGPRVQALESAPSTNLQVAMTPTNGAAESMPGEPVLATVEGCPTGTFADEGACVSLPDPIREERFGEDPVGAPEGEAAWAGHHDKVGRWVAYEQIPRRPDRPADYDAYVYPIPPGLPGGHYVVSGYDLDRPDAEQRRGRTLRAVGHGAVDLPQKKGTPIAMVPLDHQIGDATVIHVGTLMGYSVVTANTVREGGREREYVVIYGHLDHAAEGLKVGDTLRAGETVGFVGDTGSPELVHLHLEARRVRDGVEGTKLRGARILAEDATIVCDPRNVLPMRK